MVMFRRISPEEIVIAVPGGPLLVLTGSKYFGYTAEAVSGSNSS
jgi:hypothetical protein